AQRPGQRPLRAPRPPGASPSRSTTCPAAPWSPTSSTPWPSPPSRPRGRPSMPRVLVVNTGSSSIKYQLFEMHPPKVLASGVVERIGEPGSKLPHRAGDAEPLVVEDRVADHSEGFKRWVRGLASAGDAWRDVRRATY